MAKGDIKGFSLDWVKDYNEKWNIIRLKLILEAIKKSANG